MNLSVVIPLLIIALVFIAIYFIKREKDMVYVKSDIDNEMYMVRRETDRQEASNMLATLKKNIYEITKYMMKKLENEKTAKENRYIEFKPYILQLNEKIKNVEIRESSSNSVYTSYTVNKGEQIIFCIRSKDIDKALNGKIHDINLLMYVTLHEISHVACPEYDHTPLFKKIFHFICEEAIELGIYKKIPFNEVSHEYCGMQINDSII
jgi:hypothetical protein